MGNTIISIRNEDGDPNGDWVLIKDLDLSSEEVKNKLNQFLDQFSKPEPDQEQELILDLRTHKRDKISPEEERARKETSANEAIAQYGLRQDHPFTSSDISSILNHEKLIGPYLGLENSWKNMPKPILNHYLAQACDTVENGVLPVKDQIKSTWVQDLAHEDLDAEFLAIAIYLTTIAEVELANCSVVTVNRALSFLNESNWPSRE